MVLSAAEPVLPFRPCPRPSSQSPNPIPRHDPTLTLAQPPPPRRYRRLMRVTSLISPSTPRRSHAGRGSGPRGGLASASAPSQSLASAATAVILAAGTPRLELPPASAAPSPVAEPLPPPRRSASGAAAQVRCRAVEAAGWSCSSPPRRPPLDREGGREGEEGVRAAVHAMRRPQLAHRPTRCRSSAARSPAPVPRARASAAAPREGLRRDAVAPPGPSSRHAC